MSSNLILPVPHPKGGLRWQFLARFICLQSELINWQNERDSRCSSQAVWAHVLPCPPTHYLCDLGQDTRLLTACCVCRAHSKHFTNASCLHRHPRQFNQYHLSPQPGSNAPIELLAHFLSKQVSTLSLLQHPCLWTYPRTDVSEDQTKEPIFQM